MILISSAQSAWVSCNFQYHALVVTLHVINAYRSGLLNNVLILISNTAQCVMMNSSSMS